MKLPIVEKGVIYKIKVVGKVGNRKRLQKDVYRTQRCKNCGDILGEKYIWSHSYWEDDPDKIRIIKR